MMMRQILTAAFAVISVSAQAQTANWAFVANCGEPGQVRRYSYDESSLRAEGASLMVRLRGDYSQTAGSRSKEARIVWEINCADRTFVERERSEFDAAGKVVARYDHPTGTLGITRNSIAEKVAGRLCA